MRDSSNSILPKVAVIIPFFQRTSGLLPSCLQSVLAQVGPFRVEVIVVDDGSPVKAHEELNGLGSLASVRILEQPNRGPGAARNAGLDSVDHDTDYVAFLDSDDRWNKDFLADAVWALGRGYDVFFADTVRYNSQASRFSWRADKALNLVADDHRLISSDRRIYEFSGDLFDFLIRSSSVISTSTLVYDFRKYRRIRFDPALYNGQDRLFKLELMNSANSIAFSARVGACEDRGVNIFDSAVWGSAKSVRLNASYIAMGRIILARFSLKPVQRSHVRAELRNARSAFAGSVWASLRSVREIDWVLLRRTISADWSTLGTLVLEPLFSILRRASRRL